MCIYIYIHTRMHAYIYIHTDFKKYFLGQKVCCLPWVRGQPGCVVPFTCKLPMIETISGENLYY